MPLAKRRKTNKSGSRSNSRAATPVPPNSRSSSPTSSRVPANASSKATTGSLNSLNPPLVLTSEKRRGVYECDYCHSDISQLPRIRCAECPDFDLCLECFLTTDHTSAIARLKASVEARTAVDNLHASGGHQVQHQGKQAPTVASSGGGGESSAGTLSSAWHTGSGAINHDDSHGYRVCDNTRYPMFPSFRKVMPARPNNSLVVDGGAGSTRGSVSGEEEDKSQSSTKNNADDDQDGDVMDIDAEERLKSNASESYKGETGSTPSPLSHDVMLIPDDPKAVWTVEEDLRLLDGIGTHGLGNWTDIAEAVSGQGSSGKTPKRCMERYFDDFLGRYGHILPPYTLVDDGTEDKEDGEGNTNNDTKDGASTEGGGGSSVGSVTKDVDPTRLSKRRHSIMVRTTSSASMQSLGRFNKKLKPVPTESLPEYQVVLRNFRNPRVPTKIPAVYRGQEVGRDQSAKAEQLFVKTVASLSTEEAQRIRQEWMETKYLKPGGPTVLPNRPEDVVQLPGAELAGFMPRRGDFDIEWENDAEQALADMEFLPGDLEGDKKLKLKVLNIYNAKLAGRENRKNFILSRKLHDYRKNQEKDEKLPRDERDLVRRMRLFERFHSPEEHKKFLQDILKAKRLRKEIAQFQMYRRMGITSVAEAERYELDKSRRNFHKQAVLNKQTVGQGAAPAASGEVIAASANTSGKKEERSADDTNDSLWKGYRNNDRSGRRRSVIRSHDDATESTSFGQTDAASQPSKIDSVDDKHMDSVEPATINAEKTGETNEVKSGEGYGKNDTSAANDSFVIEEMDGFDLLSEKEASLCRKIRLTPTQYVEVKKTLINESLRSGLLDSTSSTSRRTVVMIDVEKRDNVVEFMVQAGWVSNKIGTMARTISE